MRPLHPWTLDVDEAAWLQEKLRKRLRLTWDGRQVNTIGGVGLKDLGESVRAAIVVLDLINLSPIETVISQLPTEFPYIPGLMAFRVLPTILSAWKKLNRQPEVLMLPGQGIAHPRGCGLASHLRLWLELPTIGVAKHILYGLRGEVGAFAGEWSELADEHDPSRVLGAGLTTHTGSQPVYVSPGHLIDLAHALELTLLCLHGFRLPEPLRLAHAAAAPQYIY